MTRHVQVTHTEPKSFAVKALNWLFDRYKVSAIDVTDRHGELVQLGSTVKGIPVPQITFFELRTLVKGWLNGMNGIAEAWIEGNWDTADLDQVMKWALANEQALRQSFKGNSATRALGYIQHKLRDNSRSGSRKNISYHYDLGNDFYKLWLDDTMTYSAAWYTDKNDSLKQAQVQKYQKIYELCDIQPQDSIIEVGCGWGGFADHVARKNTNTLKGITLSTEQLAWAKNRLSDLPASADIDLSLTDYRDINEQYDRLVSIEMFEAVGENHWPDYFNMLNETLKPGGTAVLQVIVIDESRFERYRRNPDFIQKYIFPGGMLPTKQAMADLCDQNNLSLEQEISFGKDYARTLTEWREAFNKNWPQIKQIGYDERFKRMWQYYLSYCEAGFMSDSIDVCLFKIRKP